MRVMRTGNPRAEPNEIHDLQDAKRVDNEERDEPPLLFAAGSVPESEPFKDQRPEDNDHHKRYERRKKRGLEWRIKRGEWLHIRKLYHTLITMRYLGVDYGSSKIGLALSDEGGAMGFPHAIISNTPRLVDELCALVAKENVGAVVIGESRTLEGGENPIAKDARLLGEQLTARAGVPVFYESEVFTSAEARRAPAKEAKTRAPQKRGQVDASAAALILTSYLSRTDHGPH
jgi:putative Holliday junction resolvase